MVEDHPLRGITRTARAELKQAHGGNAIVLDEACEQIAIPVVRVFHVALRPQSFWLPPLWCYCVEVDDGER